MTKKEIDIEQEAMKLLNWLSEFGKNKDGGITRLLYTPEWVEAQNDLEKHMNKEGLKTEYDEIGNLFGRLEGSKYKDETILTGSHIDTVKNGGHYDGQLGIVSALIAVKYLNEKYGEPLRNIEIVSMAEEEGSRFPYSFWGSKNIVGRANKTDVENIKDFNDESFIDAMHGAGFDFKPVNSDIRKDLKAFIELHIEQGGILEKEQTSIGIVEHIVGQRHYNISVTGLANHAGTTPMGDRKDAFNAVSQMAVAIHDIALEHGDPLVATIGQINLQPNSVNVVPGNVDFTIDCRHTNREILVKVTKEMEEKMQAIASKLNVEIDMDLSVDEEPTPMDKRVVEIIQKQCKQKDLNYKKMHSGAGHDSQIIGAYIPTAMIFVPSREGISHNPCEFTGAEHIVKGIHALIGTLYEMGYKEKYF